MDVRGKGSRPDQTQLGLGTCVQLSGMSRYAFGDSEPP
jgi:hypothetical protein